LTVVAPGAARYGQRKTIPPGGTAGNSKLNTLADLVAAAKQDQKRPDFGTFSNGYRLGIEWFANAAGVKINNVPR